MTPPHPAAEDHDQPASRDPFYAGLAILVLLVAGCLAVLAVIAIGHHPGY